MNTQLWRTFFTKKDLGPCHCGCGVPIVEKSWVVETQPGHYYWQDCFKRVWGGTFTVDTNTGEVKKTHHPEMLGAEETIERLYGPKKKNHG